jgi:hypothetical protein
MDPKISRLGQFAAKGGALVMLAAMTAYLVWRDPLALLAVPILVSIVQLLCLIEGPWTQPLLQRLPVRIRVKR